MISRQSADGAKRHMRVDTAWPEFGFKVKNIGPTILIDRITRLAHTRVGASTQPDLLNVTGAPQVADHPGHRYAPGLGVSDSDLDGADDASTRPGCATARQRGNAPT